MSLQQWLEAYRCAKVPTTCAICSPGWQPPRESARYAFYYDRPKPYDSLLCRQCAVKVIRTSRRIGEGWRLMDVNRWFAFHACAKEHAGR